MTANLEQMMKFRDLQVAEDFARMAELGYMDKEYEVFGCVFYEKGKRKYLVGVDDAKIVDAMIRGGQKNFYPSTMMTLCKTCAVPLGQEEEVLYEVKKSLAKELQASFSQSFYENVLAVFDALPVDDAYEELKAYQDALLGVYDYNRLQCFESLLDVAHQRGVVSQVHFEEFSAWLKKIYRQMDDDVMALDVFNKELWGIVYRQNGKDVSYVNAKKESVYFRKLELEEEGAFVTPMFHKVYGYNYTKTLNDVRDEFRREIFRWLDEDYLARLQALNRMQGNYDVEAYVRYGQLLKNENKEEALRCWRMYGRKKGLEEN